MVLMPVDQNALLGLLKVFSNTKSTSVQDAFSEHSSWDKFLSHFRGLLARSTNPFVFRIGPV